MPASTPSTSSRPLCSRRSCRPGADVRETPRNLGRSAAILERHDLAELGPHLEREYGIRVAATRPLDVGVIRVDRADGPAWVARVYPASRSFADVEAEARTLVRHVEAGFPAERPASDRGGPQTVEAVLKRYTRHVTLEAEEIRRVPAILPGRPLVLAAWSYAVGRRSAASVAEAIPRTLATADRLASIVEELVPGG
jgi:hypothetical protein